MRPIDTGSSASPGDRRSAFGDPPARAAAGRRRGAGASPRARAGGERAWPRRRPTQWAAPAPASRSPRPATQQPLQIERRIRIDDDARVELVERDSAERDLQRRARVDAGERQRLPAHELLRGRAVERAEIADRHVAGVSRARPPRCPGIEDEASLGATAPPVTMTLRLRLEIGAKRHQVDTGRVDSPIDGERVGRERADERSRPPLPMRARKSSVPLAPWALLKFSDARTRSAGASPAA